MSKLHELLAVESNLENQTKKTVADLANTFEKKRHLFGSKIVTFIPNEEGRSPITEEQSDIQSTVMKELDWVSGIIAKSVDVSYQIDAANTVAKADLVLEDGTVLAKDVPATSLLALEKDVKLVQELAQGIPTLDPAKGFQQDEQKGLGIFKARETRTTRTKKDKRVLVAYEATDKHPAQVQILDVDVAVGILQAQEWSSLITPAQKADIMDRCDILLRAIKKARARANEVDIDVAGVKIGKRLLDYVFHAKS